MTEIMNTAGSLFNFQISRAKRLDKGKRDQITEIRSTELTYISFDTDL